MDIMHQHEDLMQLWNILKRFTYQAGISFAKFIWRAKGGRRITVFGHDYLLVPETIFPHYRNFKLPRDGYLSDMVRYADYVQFHSAALYVSELGDRPVIVEAGAHHGAYAIVLGRIVQPKQGRVIALEPNPESFAILKENVRLNGLNETVICECVAAGDKAGSMPMEMMGSQSRIASAATSSCNVNVLPLSALLAKYGIKHLDLLMIDVEGAELSVLKGFPWESVSVEQIYCELHPYAWKDFNYSSEDMSMFLNRRRYRCFDMYFREHVSFESDDYIGPALFCKRNV